MIMMSVFVGGKLEYEYCDDLQNDLGDQGKFSELDQQMELFV